MEAAPTSQLTKTLLDGQATVLARWNLAVPDPNEPWSSTVIGGHDHGRGHAADGHGHKAPKGHGHGAEPGHEAGAAHGHGSAQASPD